MLRQVMRDLVIYSLSGRHSHVKTLRHVMTLQYLGWLAANRALPGGVSNVELDILPMITSRNGWTIQPMCP